MAWGCGQKASVPLITQGYGVQERATKNFLGTLWLENIGYGIGLDS